MAESADSIASWSSSSHVCMTGSGPAVSAPTNMSSSKSIDASVDGLRTSSSSFFATPLMAESADSIASWSSSSHVCITGSGAGGLPTERSAFIHAPSSRSMDASVDGRVGASAGSDASSSSSSFASSSAVPKPNSTFSMAA